MNNQPQPAVPQGWQFKRNEDGSVGIFAPPAKPGESPRTSHVIYPSQSPDLHELLGKLADQQAADQSQEPVTKEQVTKQNESKVMKEAYRIAKGQSEFFDRMMASCSTPQPATQSDPVAWLDLSKMSASAMVYATGWKSNDKQSPLYTTPAAPSQPVTLTDDQADAVSMALRRAWQLGQTYWQQADSDYISQHKKSEETQRKFEKLCDDTIAALREKEGGV